MGGGEEAVSIAAPPPGMDIGGTTPERIRTRRREREEMNGLYQSGGQKTLRRRGLPCLVLAVVLLVAGMTAQAGQRSSQRRTSGKRQVTVMTRNLYQGADVGRVTSEPDPTLIPLRVAETVQMMLHNEFPARALGVAQEIAETGPDLVALQEVTLIRTQTPSDFMSPAPQPATEVLIDHLEILLDALETLGLPYDVVNVVTNFDMEMPMVVPSPGGISLTDVRLTDRGAILARTDLPRGHLRLRNARTGNFETMLSIPTAGGEIPVLRGWCSVDAFVRGRRFRFIAAHPEAFHPFVRVEQINELLAGPAATRMPVVIAGDLNSDASSDMPVDGYAQLLEAGFTDAWVEVGNAPDSGLTFGHNEDLTDPNTMLTTRLDMVLYRGRCFRPMAADVLGEELVDRVPSLFVEGVELWPSDHAGVAAVLRLR